MDFFKTLKQKARLPLPVMPNHPSLVRCVQDAYNRSSFTPQGAGPKRGSKGAPVEEPSHANPPAPSFPGDFSQLLDSPVASQKNKSIPSPKREPGRSLQDSSRRHFTYSRASWLDPQVELLGKITWTHLAKAVWKCLIHRKGFILVIILVIIIIWGTQMKP